MAAVSLPPPHDHAGGMVPVHNILSDQHKTRRSVVFLMPALLLLVALSTAPGADTVSAPAIRATLSD